MKRFRYVADPLFVLAIALYALNRFWLKPHFGGMFLVSWFNDLLLIPAALPPLLWVHRALGWRDALATPSAGEIWFHVFVWSVVGEIVAPQIIHHATADVWDVVCYATSGLVAWLWWRRRKLIAGRWRT